RSILIMKGSVACVGAPEEVFDKYRELYVSHHNEKLLALNREEKYRLLEGDGSVLVKQITFLDAQGKPSQAFFTGGPMTIDIAVERSPEAEEFYTFIGFLLDNRYVGHIDTEALAVGGNEIQKIAMRPGRSISVKIDSLVMLNGIYS